MKTLSILVPLLAGVSVQAYSELLRGGYHERPRRLDGGSCDSDGDCNKHGDCDGVIQGQPNSGTCSCDNGWSGDSCDDEVCGKVKGGCGKHGTCKKNKYCDCDDGWTGKDCDDETNYHMKVIVGVINPIEVSSLDQCNDDLEKFMDYAKDQSDKSLLDLSRVTTVFVPVECGDSDYDTVEMLERMVNLPRRRHLKSRSSRGSGSGDNDDEPIVSAMIFSSSDRSTNAPECFDEIEKAAKKFEDGKPKDLKKLNGEVVYMESGECDAKTIEKIWKHA